MKLNIISFTRAGSQLNQKISVNLVQYGHDVSAYSIPKYAEPNGLIPMMESLKEWTKQSFLEADGIIFIGACGIAVRSIASYIKGKSVDPAVLVLDEAGSYAISLLSGHLGGANELATQVAKFTGGQPIITTATDVNQRFAVDVFARKNNLYITDMQIAKEISIAILEGETVGLISDVNIVGELPESIKESTDANIGIYIGIHEKKSPFKRTLRLIPRVITIGIGCRKGTSCGEILKAISSCFMSQQLSRHSIEQIASIDIKQEESGIIEAAKSMYVPFYTFSARELGRLEGDYSQSKFVKQITGVDNVCERSAVLASNRGKLVQKKVANKGITIALAIRDWSIHFE